MPEIAGAAWRKSSYSAGNGGDCVEVARLDDDGTTAVRHSKRPEDGVLIFTGSEILAFVRGCKDGEFDYLTS